MHLRAPSHIWPASQVSIPHLICILGLHPPSDMHLWPPSPIWHALTGNLVVVAGLAVFLAFIGNFFWYLLEISWKFFSNTRFFYQHLNIFQMGIECWFKWGTNGDRWYISEHLNKHLNEKRWGMGIHKSNTRMGIQHPIEKYGECNLNF